METVFGNLSVKIAIEGEGDVDRHVYLLQKYLCTNLR
jgi:hypothetical protein